MQLVQELRKAPTVHDLCASHAFVQHRCGARRPNRCARADTTMRSTMLLTTAGLLAAGLRPSTRLCAKSIFRGPETPTREARAANAALAEAGELLNSGDGEAAVHALVMHADALLACDGATLSALCGDDVALAELTSDVLEAVSEEALDLDHERKTLLKKLIQAAQTSEEEVDQVLEEAGDLLIETAFVDYLDGEAQRLAAESDAEARLLELLDALRFRVIQSLGMQIFGAGAEALKRVLSIEDSVMREEAFRNALESCDVDAQCDSAGILAALDETLRDVTLRGDAHPDLVEALQGLAEIAAEYDFGYSEPADDESR